MTRPRHRAPLILTVLVGVLCVACGSTSSPTAMASESAPASPSTPAAVSPSAPAATSMASTAPGSRAPSGPACAVTTQAGILPSDRLVDLAISSTTTHDLLTFVFEPSSPGPAGPPRGTLEAAAPPFSFAGSGQAFDLLGEHAVQIRFTGMTVASESGDATYRGPTDVKPAMAALRQAIQYDASEGIVAWDVGYDGPGCVTLVREGNDVTVMIAHPEAPAG